MNYYEILKIPENASENQIKSSYKKLVKKYHPDLYVGNKDFAEQKIKEINEAYAVLSNSQHKLAYDESLHLTTNPAPYYYSSKTQTSSYNETNSFSDSTTQWSFTQSMAEKFGKLTAQRQLQIFILIFVIFLALFLINLIEVKHYLSPTITSSNMTTPNNNTSTPSLDNSDYLDEFKTFDDLFYDFLKSYENEFENLF